MLCIIGPTAPERPTDGPSRENTPGSERPWLARHRSASSCPSRKSWQPEWAQVSETTVFEQLTVFENLELALAGSRSFLKTLRGPHYGREPKRIDEVLDIIASRRSAGRREEYSRMGRSSGSKSACC